METNEVPNSVWFALIIFTIAGIAYCYPIFYNINYWGWGDWDYVAFLNGAARITITEYYQFPLWNPYYFGGLPMLGNPQSQFLSPFFFLFVIPFKEFIAFKIQILLHLIIGMLGMFFVSRYLKFGKYSQYLASFIYLLSSVYVYTITEGHYHHIATAWIPWIFFFYLKSYENWKYVFAAAGLLTLMFFQGSIYPFPQMILFLGVYSFFKFIKERDFKVVKIIALILIFTVLFSGIKLMPTMEFLNKYPRTMDASEGVERHHLARMLLYAEYGWDRWGFLYNYFDFTRERGLRWHEFSGYVGLIPLILAILGSILIIRKRWDLVIMTVIFLFLVLGSKAPINFWKYLHYLPLYKYHQLPSRFILFLIFLIAILSGFAISKLEKFEIKKYKFSFLTIAMILFILFDLITLHNQIFYRSFVFQPMQIERSEEFSQVSNYLNYGSYSSMYPVLLSNKGLIRGYEAMAFTIYAKPTQKINCSSYVDWLLLGPVDFELEDKSFLNDINISKEFKRGDNFIGWRLYKPVPFQLQEYGMCMMDFRFGYLFDYDAIKSTVYLLNYVYSPDQRRVQTRFAKDDIINFWVNDELIYKHDIAHQISEKPPVVFNLNKGWNKILLRCSNVDSNWFLTIEGFTYPEKNDTVLNDLIYDVGKKREIIFLSRVAKEEQQYKEIYLLGGGDTKIDYFSPNKIKISVDAESEDTLVLNQNYYEGWKTKENLKIENYNGLISVKVNPDIKEITFYYLPNSFLKGIFLSFLGVFLMIIMLKFKNDGLFYYRSKRKFLRLLLGLKEHLSKREENEI